MEQNVPVPKVNTIKNFNGNKNKNTKICNKNCSNRQQQLFKQKKKLLKITTTTKHSNIVNST